ncbi:MAG: ABC transporter substrate-binding protein [Bacteroidetes bacterium]|nr:ABC transporter substrate-binding protein [Bacteroidota bacterium]
MKIIDQIGREILLKQSPVRIVSLVPSITELLFDLGLEEEIVGITRYCILPKEKVKNATKIGGTKDFDLEQIVQLKADFIFTNKEENPQRENRNPTAKCVRICFGCSKSRTSTIDDR